MKQLILGPLMIDIAGYCLTSDDREKIAHPNTGGIILFSRNYESPEQLVELNQQIRKARSGEIIIAVDQEGGRVQRFQEGFSLLPAASHYSCDKSLAEVAGWLMASELLAVDVDFSFAPVLDVDCGISEVIGNRAFSSHSEQVVTLASAFRQGMRKAGMSAVGKHFPGHGAVAQDSHLTLPVDNRDLETIRQKDLLPYRKLIAEGLEAIMPAHVVYSQIDSLPAGFSSVWLQDILRRELSFNGAIFSDDLTMAGAASIGDFPVRAEMALEAGCDMVLVCNNRLASEQLLECVKVSASEIRQHRIMKMRSNNRVNRNQLLKSDQWQLYSKQIRTFREANAGRN